MLRDLFKISLFFFTLSLSPSALAQACSSMSDGELVAMMVGTRCESAVASADQTCSATGGGDAAEIARQVRAANPVTKKGPAGEAQACQAEIKLHQALLQVNANFSNSCGEAATSCANTCSRMRFFLPPAPAEPVSARDQILADQTCRARVVLSLSRSANGCEESQAQKAEQARLQSVVSQQKIQEAQACVSRALQENEQLSSRCRAEPRNPECALADIDCNNPNNARTHPICVCKNPEAAANHPVCNPEAPPGEEEQVGEFASIEDPLQESLENSRLSPTAMESLLGEEADIEAIQAEGPPVGADGGGPSGQFSGSSTGGPKASGDKIGEDKPKGPYKGPFDTDILKGTRRAKGGSQYAGSGSGGRDSDFERARRMGMGQGFARTKGLKSPNIAQMINATNGFRRVASSAQIKDGVTGAMGPTIWEKLSQRYKKVRSQLKP